MKIDLSKPLPKNADAADFLESGIGWEEFRAWAKPRVRIYTPLQAQEQPIVAGPQASSQKIDEDPSLRIVSQFDLWAEMKLTMTKGGVPHCNYDNVNRALRFHNPLMGIVWYDEFHDKVFTDYGTKIRREWTDNDDAELATYFQGILGMSKMSKECIRTGITMYAMRNTKNEPKDWFETLQFDGTDRLSHFFEKYFGAEYNAYTHKAAMNFWVGMVARVFRPGCKLDNMIVLEGPQGIGKSSALQIIGGPWYAESTESIHTKEFYMVLQGKLLVEIAELDSFNKAEVTRIKQAISCPMDRYRASYDRRPLDHKRMSVFCGTTNEDSYLRDATGGRRFWPIRCREIDRDGLSRDREQLFAQAVLQFKQGDEWYVMPLVETLIEQEARRQVDEREPIIAEFLRHKDETTIVEIAELLRIELKDIHREQISLGRCLRNIGFVRKPHAVSDKDKGGQKRVWVRK